MFYRAKNGRLDLGGCRMDYIRFGTGPRALAMLPGVGDGLKTVKGMAVPFALLYRALAREFTVYVFSRRVELPAHMNTRAMAADLSDAMAALRLARAAVVGVSQGGMIAQWLAIDHPERVGRLVLVATSARPNDALREAVSAWRAMAARGDYRGILLDTARRSYTEKRLKAARVEYGLLGSLGRPGSFDRFLTQAEACLTHDASAELHRVQCPTLVIGGTDDKIVTGQASVELAERIPGAALHLYQGLGHGLYEEAPDFLRRVADFCR